MLPGSLLSMCRISRSSTTVTFSAVSTRHYDNNLGKVL